MKTFIKDPFLLSALIACLCLILAVRVTAQTFTTLYSFTAIPQYPGPYTNSDGVNPYAGVILSGNTLYGTAYSGGSSGNGTVFAINADGTGFTKLHTFTAASGLYPYANSDGVNPQGGLVLSGTSNTLYGTAVIGGSSGYGAVFKVNTDGSGFTTLHSFMGGSDGINPLAGLVLSSNTLYGTAFYGGSSGYGMVFGIDTDGTRFTNLHSFTATACYNCPNSDGARPQAGLILAGKTLYGTASQGGSSGNGTVFAVNTDGTGFTTLHSFTALNNNTNSDGAGPPAGLILSGSRLYGTAYRGGGSDNGTVFSLNTNGTGFMTLHSFTYSDGANPQAGLILSGNILYGTAYGGGSSGNGTVFALNTDGTGFTNLHSFLGYPSFGGGANPHGGLILSGNILYGTAYSGGSSGKGTVFSFSLGSVSAPVLQFDTGTGSLSVSNGFFQMHLTGPSGSSVVVEASGDFQAWTPIQTNALPPAGLNVPVPVGANQNQFFRARVAP